jgi:AAA family ATP:ADP antiporter
VFISNFKKDRIMVTATRTYPDNAARNRLEKFLALFSDTRAGEGWGALLLAADIFCLFASYYLLKTARESLVLSEGGAEVKSYASAAQALILLGAVPLYGIVASRVSRSRLINGVMLFFVSHLALFYALAVHGVHIGVAFFLWVGVFNLMIVAQFWAFANEICTVERGQRLFPLVGVGGSLGAWVGARAASKLMTAQLLPTDLLLAAAIGLLVCVGLNYCVTRRAASTGGLHRRGDSDSPLKRDGGIQLIIGDRYLRLIAVLVILVNVVNTTGEYLLGRLVVSEAARAIADGAAGGPSKAQLIGIFYGDFFGWVNLVSLLIQLLLVSRLFKGIGVAGSLFVLPLIALGSYGLLAMVPLLGAVRLGKILENSTDYSLYNTARHALFLPTSPEAKFKAKQAIDALCWRVGDLLQAGLVFVGTRLAFGVRQFALLNETLVLFSVVVVIAITREYKRRTLADDSERRAA